jgi:hypothetical protein
MVENICKVAVSTGQIFGIYQGNITAIILLASCPDSLVAEIIDLEGLCHN